MKTQHTHNDHSDAFPKQGGCLGFVLIILGAVAWWVNYLC
jgi:hypothetical protein